MIKGVEELASQFEVGRFRHPEVLLHTDIPVIHTRPEQNAASGVSKKPGLRSGEARGIEPAASVRTDVIAQLVATSIAQAIGAYGSEVASRGILFVVKDEELCGLGQFGVDRQPNGGSVDAQVQPALRRRVRR